MNTDKKGGLMNHMANEPQWLRVTFVVLLFSLTILAIAIAFLMYFGKAQEGNLVSKDKYQAVFLTNGQVYFGQLEKATDDYFELRDIYYLNTQSQEGTEADSEEKGSFSLIKLGCELHGPVDQMVINRGQVSFWENLTKDGKVSDAIAKWKKQNPKGQECTDTSNTTQQSPSSTTEETTTPSTKDDTATEGQ